jgi:cell division protein ZapE
MIAQGTIERDAAQEAVVARLAGLAERLVERELPSKSSALGWLFSRKSRPESLTGLYIWGQVGRGKTMLMDLFYEGLNVRLKRRTHFHAFMTDVHERVHAWRQKARAGEVKGADPIAPVGQAIAAEAHVLCFDELAVTDIADAMLLGRLFETLFAAGVTVVATSNRAPEDLYKDGLNRSLFVPFIHMLEQRLDVLRLDARTDYRMEKLAGAEVYLTPANADSEQRLEEMFHRLTGGARWRPVELALKGRAVSVPKAAQGVAMARFAELCEQPLGAADYLAIAQAFHTVVISGVPVMHQDSQSAAKRFINMIDVFYDHGVKTVISAEAPAQELYKGTRGPEVFEFDRTVSRLIEMRSESYLVRPHGSTGDVEAASSGKIVET